MDEVVCSQPSNPEVVVAIVEVVDEAVCYRLFNRVAVVMTAIVAEEVAFFQLFSLESGIVEVAEVVMEEEEVTF